MVDVLERRSAEAGRDEIALRLDKSAGAAGAGVLAQSPAGPDRARLRHARRTLVTHASRKPRLGQTLVVDLVPTEEALAFRPEPLALDIVFEDEHLLAVNKPAGLSSIRPRATGPAR